jgi:hypothetical protein
MFSRGSPVGAKAVERRGGGHPLHPRLYADGAPATLHRPVEPAANLIFSHRKLHNIYIKRLICWFDTAMELAVLSLGE